MALCIKEVLHLQRAFEMTSHTRSERAEYRNPNILTTDEQTVEHSVRFQVF